MPKFTVPKCFCSIIIKHVHIINNSGVEVKPVLQVTVFGVHGLKRIPGYRTYNYVKTDCALARREGYPDELKIRPLAVFFGRTLEAGP